MPITLCAIKENYISHKLPISGEIMRFLIVLMALLLGSCISFQALENDPDIFNIYLYYEGKSTFQYTLTEQVSALDTIPNMQLTPGTTWRYHILDDTTSTARISEVRLDSLNDTLAFFTVDDKHVVAHLSTHCYTALYVNGVLQELNTLVMWLQTPLPIPHVNELQPPYQSPCLQLEDGSYAYPLEMGIYSSTYGVIKGRSCLISLNNGPFEPIARTINEYKVREAAWLE